jgi:hypothetical protein
MHDSLLKMPSDDRGDLAAVETTAPPVQVLPQCGVPTGSGSTVRKTVVRYLMCACARPSAEF